MTSSVVEVGCGERDDDDEVTDGGADAVDDENGVLEGERLKQDDETTSLLSSLPYMFVFICSNYSQPTSHTERTRT